MAYPVATMKGGGTKMSDGTVVYKNKAKNIQKPQAKGPVALGSVASRIPATPEKTVPKLNLFDFSTLNPSSRLSSASVQVPGATGGGMRPPTLTSKPLPQTPRQEPKISPIFGVAKANAGEDTIAKFYNDTSIDDDKKQMLSDAIDQGMPRAEVEQYLNKEFYGETQAPQERPGFFSRVGTDIATRAKNVGQALGEENPIVSGIYGAGNIAGAVGDIFGEALVSGYEMAGQPGKEKVKELFSTPIGQKALNALSQGAEAYDLFKKENPSTARTLEGAVNIASILPAYKGVQVAGKGVVAGAGKVAPKIVKGVSKGLEDVRINRATKQIAKGEDILFEAVNPTTRENKAILRQRVKDLVPFIDKNPINNSLEGVKSRIDTAKNTAGKAIEDFEATKGIKGTVKTQAIIDKLKSTYQEKIGKSFINADEAKIAQDLIDTLKGFGKEVKDADLIKIRRAWDTIEKKNKGFMMSAESTSKGDIFGDANKFFREEIKNSNPEYAKYLQDYHKTKTIGDVIEATIQRRVGQQGGGFIKRGLQNIARVGGASGGIPGYLATEALIQGSNLLSSPGFKLTRGAKLLQKGEKTLQGKSIINPKKNGVSPDASSSSMNNMAGGKAIIKPETIPEGYFKNALGQIVKKPSNKKGGFIKMTNPLVKPKANPLIEEAKKYSNFIDFGEAVSSIKNPIFKEELKKMYSKGGDLESLFNEAKGIRKPEMINLDVLDKIQKSGKREFNQALKDAFEGTGEDIIYGKINIDKLKSTQYTDANNLSEYKHLIKNGDSSPIVVEYNGKDYAIYDGHHRYEAYKQLGIKDVPIVINELGESGLVKGTARIFKKQNNSTKTIKPSVISKK